MFKALIGKGHPEFSTNRQQDAQEFFLHLINMVEVRAGKVAREGAYHTPSVCLRFSSLLSPCCPFFPVSPNPLPPLGPHSLRALSFPCEEQLHLRRAAKE